MRSTVQPMGQVDVADPKLGIVQLPSENLSKKDPEYNLKDYPNAAQEFEGNLKKGYQEALICGLSGKLLTDAVIDLKTGKSFDREAYTKRYPDNSVSLSNFALKSIVEVWLQPKFQAELDAGRIPQVLTCSLTSCVFEEPVFVDKSGHTYSDNPSFRQWILNKRTDPISRAELESGCLLVRNKNVEAVIEWCKATKPQFAITANMERRKPMRPEARIETMWRIWAESESLRAVRRCRFMADEIEKTSPYSSTIEMLSKFTFVASKEDLLQKFKQGLIRVGDSANEDVRNKLNLILKAIKKTKTWEELRQQIVEVQLTAEFVAELGMSREELFKLLAPRIFSPNRSATHANFRLMLFSGDAIISLQTTQAIINSAERALPEDIQSLEVRGPTMKII